MKARVVLGLALVLAAAALEAGCFAPGEERAERDAEVGRASGSGLQVRVQGGLAAIRGVSQDRLHLWESAPSIVIELESDQAPRSLELFVENCMPGAKLVARTGQVHIEVSPSERRTECVYQLELRTAEVELALGVPGSDSPSAFHFGVLSDVQEAIDRVQDVFSRINQETQLSFLLGAGDLTEQGTRDELERFQAELKSLRIPYYTTLGNHELGESPSLYHDYFGRGSASFTFQGVRFTLLDSASATLDSRVDAWLDDWLTRGQSSVHVVAMHIPPLDPTGVRNGAFASRNEAAELLGRLAAGRVDLTLYGHVHSYYRFNNAGIDAHISGGGGAIPEKFDGIGRHFLDVAVTPSAVQGVKVVRVD
jgi:predicted phosphodiesterase